MCFSFGFDPASDVMDQTGQVLQYSCALTEKSETNQSCFTAAITPCLLVSHLRCSEAAVRGVPQGIEVSLAALAQQDSVFISWGWVLLNRQF